MNYRNYINLEDLKNFTSDSEYDQNPFLSIIKQNKLSNEPIYDDDFMNKLKACLKENLFININLKSNWDEEDNSKSYEIEIIFNGEKITSADLYVRN